MPNWCENLIIVDDREDIIQDIKNKFVSKGNDECGREGFDFDKIIPIPENLKDKDKTIQSKEERDFCIKNWGTKWNGFVNDVFGDGINFDTAWSPASGIVKELSKIYNCKIELMFWEPGMCFGGVEVYENGELVLEDYYDEINKENFKTINKELQEFIGEENFEWNEETGKTLKKKRQVK